MDEMLKLLSEIGLNTAEGIEYTGGVEKYISAVRRYHSNHDKMRSAVDEAFIMGNMGEYAIKVHSLKSNSRMIGADVLAGRFEKLELAAREGDRDYVNSNTREVMLLYGNLIEHLAPIGLPKESPVASQIDIESAKSLIDELIEALDDFDDERAKELAKKLYGYSFKNDQKSALDKAVDYINDFLYDEAIELAKQIKSAME